MSTLESIVLNELNEEDADDDEAMELYKIEQTLDAIDKEDGFASGHSTFKFPNKPDCDYVPWYLEDLPVYSEDMKLEIFELMEPGGEAFNPATFPPALPREEDIEAVLRGTVDPNVFFDTESVKSEQLEQLERVEPLHDGLE